MPMFLLADIFRSTFWWNLWNFVGSLDCTKAVHSPCWRFHPYLGFSLTHYPLALDDVHAKKTWKGREREQMKKQNFSVSNSKINPDLPQSRFKIITKKGEKIEAYQPVNAHRAATQLTPKPEKLLPSNGLRKFSSRTRGLSHTKTTAATIKTEMSKSLSTLMIFWSFAPTCIPV